MNTGRPCWQTVRRCRRLSSRYWASAKVNFAGLGNVVPAMHLHIIGRHPQDPCWPQPVWGNLPSGESYTPQQLREWQAGLVRMIGLVAAPL